MEQLPKNQKNEVSQNKTCSITSIPNATKGVKIRNMVNDAPLKEALLYAYKVTDLKEIPIGMDNKILNDFIIGAYGGLCAEEIKLAFRLGCKGDLNIDMNHYQSFTPIYLGRVLKAYNGIRGRELSKINSKQLTGFSETQIDRKAYYELNLFMKYDSLLNGKYIFTEDDEASLYNSLTLSLNIKLATNKEKIFAKQDAESKTPKGANRAEDKRAKKVISLAKRICFKNWINRMAFEGVDIRKEITEIINQEK